MSAPTLLDRALPVDHETYPGEHPDQLPLPLMWEVTPGVSSVPELPRHLRLVGSDPAATPDEPRPPTPQPAWVARMARAIVEVADGDRPAVQLTRWVERAPLAMLEARGKAFSRHPAVRHRRREWSATRAIQQVRAIRICPVGVGAVESSAVLVGGGRGRAIGIRFEARGDAWVVTAIALG